MAQTIKQSVALLQARRGCMYFIRHHDLELVGDELVVADLLLSLDLLLVAVLLGPLATLLLGLVGAHQARLLETH